MHTPPQTRGAAGLVWGAVGVLAFSVTLVATRIAVRGIDPLLLGAGRAVVAAALAGAALALLRQRRPSLSQALRLLVVAAGVVAGFPLLTSYALTQVPAAHGAVVIALLPAATAVCVVLRTREATGWRFWFAAAAGAVAAVVFAALSGSGLGGLEAADLLLLGAVVAAAVGYAEGGLLARELGAWQTISWALILASPVMAVLTAVAWARTPPAASPIEWSAFGYVAAVSMFLGFVAWYRGLAIGPMTRVSQLQLVQPVLTIVWAALVLGERITPATALGAGAVIACAALAVRARAPRPARDQRRSAAV